MLPEFLTVAVLGKPFWAWGVFFLIVATLLVLDLGVLHRKDREMGVRESLLMTAFYVTVGLAFSLHVWATIGPVEAVDYLTGFVIEKSLSLDNIFVIALIFSAFAIPRALQHRVLFWGILGVIILRGIMIVAGAALVKEYHWVLYLFAAFLVFTGIKMMFSGVEDPEEKKELPGFVRHFRMTHELDGHKFFVRRPHPKTGKLVWWLTPLAGGLVVVEFTDLLFAVDSVPAMFAITTDPYIVFTSNIFAILGLRSLYFALSAMIARFRYLKYALAAVLIFIGSKIFLVDFLDLTKFPPAISLGVTVALIAAGVLFSLWRTRREAVPAVAEPDRH